VPAAPQPNGSTFDYLVRVILRQQISGYAADAIEARIR